MEITRADFFSYLEVQESGKTNMLAVYKVSELSGLTEEQVIYIIKNYCKLFDKHVGNHILGKER
jgi:hypothetical protein|tara:strand:+ start:18058 stop:18249 length:192 start_codon:yes stop_codon:yes gene_type:complete